MADDDKKIKIIKKNFDIQYQQNFANKEHVRILKEQKQELEDENNQLQTVNNKLKNKILFLSLLSAVAIIIAGIVLTFFT